MNKVELKDLVGGALQENFENTFKQVVENLQDVNTPYKAKREITIKLSFVQNEKRDDVKCAVAVTAKLAPQDVMATAFSIGKNLKTGELYAEEYGKQIKGQMSISDYQKQTEVIGGKEVDTETGEIVNDTVVDFRKVQ